MFSVSVNNLGIPAGFTGVLNVLVTVDLNSFYFSFKKKLIDNSLAIGKRRL